MRIISINTNGIRAAARKGFFEWMQKQKPDVVCIQETKAQEHQLDAPVFSPTDYRSYFHDAQKKGYSGVAIYTRHEPDDMQFGIGWDVMDNEGRWIRADFGNLSVISLYLQSGSSKQERQQVKYQTMDYLQPLLRAMVQEGREYIICGDWNIAHKKIDIKNWQSNQKNSGFLPQTLDIQLYTTCGLGSIQKQERAALLTDFTYGSRVLQGAADVRGMI